MKILYLNISAIPMPNFAEAQITVSRSISNRFSIYKKKYFG
jgi:hypothetical protein